jgi:serine/threonine protein kinase
MNQAGAHREPASRVGCSRRGLLGSTSPAELFTCAKIFQQAYFRSRPMASAKLRRLGEKLRAIFGMIAGSSALKEWQGQRFGRKPAGRRTVSTLTPEHVYQPEQNRKVPEIPGYRIERVLHEGSTATVYKAVQIALRRPVAIKVLHVSSRNSCESNGQTVGRHEALMRANLSHPHIVSVYDAGQLGETCYFVMEYIAGHSLREKMQRGKPWRISQALEVLQAVTQALEYIHARGVLHLDLKPENVLLTETGQAKITDFGVSQVDGSGDASGVIWGTTDYCAPEQRFGLGVDRRADVFSLAVLAYELLTGYVPGRVYVPATQRNRFLPAGVDKVLARGLARDKEERYETAEAFYRDLRQALLDKRQHPVWGSLAALAIAGIVAVPLLLRTFFNGQQRVDDRPTSPSVSSPTLTPSTDKSQHTSPASPTQKEEVPD